MKEMILTGVRVEVGPGVVHPREKTNVELLCTPAGVWQVWLVRPFQVAGFSPCCQCCDSV